jgi:parallel beta-helix repeat protein
MTRAIVSVCFILILNGCGSGSNTPEAALPPKPVEPDTVTVDPASREPLTPQSTVFTRIGVAIGRVKAGGTVKILPGIYTELLEIEKNVTLVGDGPIDKIMIAGTKRASIAIGAEVTLKNLTIRHSESETVALDVVRGKMVVEECDISNQTSTGVRVQPNGILEMRKCQVHHCKSNGFYIKGKAILEENDITGCTSTAVAIESSEKFLLKKNVIHDNMNDGVDVDLKSNGVLEDNEIHGNLRQGMCVSKSSVVTLKGNKIYRNEENGVLVNTRAQATIEGGEIFKNAKDGIQAFKDAKIDVRHVKLLENGHQGILFSENGTGTVEDCEIARSQHVGIGLIAKSTATVKRCKIYSCQSNGVSSTDESMLTLEECDVYGNTLPGVAIFETGKGMLRKNKIHNHEEAPGAVVFDMATATLEENEIYDNKMDGVRVRRGGNATMRKNIIRNNADYGIEVSQDGTGVFEDNDLRGNELAAWSVAPENLEKVKRKNNRRDETPLSRSKAGDWIDYKMALVTLEGPADIGLSITVRQRTEEEAVLEMSRTIGDKTQRKEERVDVSRRNSLLDSILDAPATTIVEQEKGEEKIQVGARSLDCSWQIYKITTVTTMRLRPQITGTLKIWRSEALPIDGTAKIDLAYTIGVKMNMELTGFGDAKTPRNTPAPGSTTPPNSTKAADPATDTVPKAEPAPPSSVTVYVMKDGRRVRSVKSVDAGDALTVKSESGKFETLQKSDIKETIQE